MNKKIDALPKLLRIPRWLSHKSYQTTDGQHRTIISNHLTHELITLDDESSQVWHKTASAKCIADVVNQSEQYGLEKQEVIGFLDDLRSESLIEIDYGISNTVDDISLLPNRTILENHNEVAGTESVEIEAEFKDWAISHGFLYSANIEVTYRCNERCIHCYNPGAAHSPEERPNRNLDELTTKDYFHLIDELDELGVFRLVFTGGELFVRRDAFEILRYARSKSISISVLTNGLLLSPPKVEVLASLYPEMVSVSIYSANPRLHDEVTCVPGSWQKSIDALKALSSKGIKTMIKCPLMNNTVKGYVLVRDLAKQIGARYGFDPIITATNDGKTSTVDLNVDSYKELVVLSMMDDSPTYVGSQETGWRKRKFESGQPICGVGDAISITPTGGLQPCIAVPQPIVSVNTQGALTSAWMDRNNNAASTSHDPNRLLRLADWRAFTHLDTEECGRHDRCEWCLCCIGASLSECGDARKPSETQCRVAAARMDAADKVSKGSDFESVCRQYGFPTDYGSIYE